MAEIAKKNGKTVAQTLLRWGLQHGTSVIPKSSKEEHSQVCVSAIRLLKGHLAHISTPTLSDVFGAVSHAAAAAAAAPAAAAPAAVAAAAGGGSCQNTACFYHVDLLQ